MSFDTHARPGDIVLWGATAMRIGGGLDLNRKLHNEPTGVRALGRVGGVLAIAGWRTVTVAIILTAVPLRLGGPFEPWCHLLFGSDRSMPGADGS